MKGLKEAVKITVRKANRELYNFCDLAFKIMKDDHTAKIININKQLYVVGYNHAMKLYINRESKFMDEVLFESTGYYHLSRNADNTYELTLDKVIVYEAMLGKYSKFNEELIIEKIDYVIQNMTSPQTCQFTKVSDLKVATIATTLGLWVKDNDVKYLNVLSPVEGFKYENMLVLEHCIETGPAEVTHTYFIMNFDNTPVVPEMNYEEQMQLALDDHPEENLQSEEYINEVDGENVQKENKDQEIYSEMTDDQEETFNDQNVLDDAEDIADMMNQLEYDDQTDSISFDDGPMDDDIAQPSIFNESLDPFMDGPTF